MKKVLLFLVLFAALGAGGYVVYERSFPSEERGRWS